MNGPELQLVKANGDEVREKTRFLRLDTGYRRQAVDTFHASSDRRAFLKGDPVVFGPAKSFWGELVGVRVTDGGCEDALIPLASPIKMEPGDRLTYTLNIATHDWKPVPA